MKFLKKYWKIILIILLSIMFLSTCATKNNYRRKLSVYEADVSTCIDSLENVIKAKTISFDSLYRVNEQLYKEIENLNKDIEIYREQNEKLHNKKVTVIVKENRQQ